MPRPKANQAKRYGSPAFVLRRSGRIVVPATATFLCRNRISLQEQNGIRGFVGRPIKRNGEKRCRITSSRAGGINGPPLLS